MSDAIAFQGADVYFKKVQDATGEINDAFKTIQQAEYPAHRNPNTGSHPPAWWIDIREHQRFVWFFSVVGVNSLFIYLLMNTVGDGINEYADKLCGGYLGLIDLGHAPGDELARRRVPGIVQNFRFSILFRLADE